MARTLWRRHLALSLALRLFARIVLLDFAVFFTWGSDLDRVGAGSSGHFGIGSHCLSAGNGSSVWRLTFR